MLEAYRDQFAREHPGSPEVVKLDQFLDYGRNLARKTSVEVRGTEQLVLKARIPDREKAVLEDFGASFYTLTGETIEGQKRARRAQGLPTFWNNVDTGDRERMLAVPSPKIEVAYFPNPENFFVPGTLGKDTDTQETMVAADAKRYGLEGITQIIPDQASVFTELTFQYLASHPGVWLFGQKYAEAQGKNWVYGRTKNPTNSSSSRVAVVGDARPDRGLRVLGWRRGHGGDGVGSPRLVVAVETK